jgi:hypothetical protein
MQSKRYILPALVLVLGLAACNDNSTSGPDYQELSRGISEIIRNDMARQKMSICAGHCSTPLKQPFCLKNRRFKMNGTYLTQ